MVECESFVAGRDPGDHDCQFLENSLVEDICTPTPTSWPLRNDFWWHFDFYHNTKLCLAVEIESLSHSNALRSRIMTVAVTLENLRSPLKWIWDSKRLYSCGIFVSCLSRSQRLAAFLPLFFSLRSSRAGGGADAKYPDSETQFACSTILNQTNVARKNEKDRDPTESILYGWPISPN